MVGRFVTSTLRILALAASAGLAQDAPPSQTRPASDKDSSADRASPPVSSVRTRAEEIEQLRREKARNLTPDLPPQAEQTVTAIQKNVLQRVFGGLHGLRPSLGGLYPRSGFAAGPEYYRPDLAEGRIQF